MSVTLAPRARMAEKGLGLRELCRDAGLDAAIVCQIALLMAVSALQGGFAGGIAVVVIAVFGAVLDLTVLRRVIGQPQFAVVMLTIGLGSIFRTFASVTWGSEIYTLPTPFGGGMVTFVGFATR